MKIYPDILKDGVSQCIQDVCGFCPCLSFSKKLPPCETLLDWLELGVARNLTLERYNNSFWLECLVVGLDSDKNIVWRLRSSRFIDAKTKKDALAFIENNGMLNFYKSRFKIDGYLAW